MSKTAMKQRRRRQQLLDLVLGRPKMLIMLQMIPRTLVVGRNTLSQCSIILAAIDVLISWVEFRKHSEE